MCKVSIIYIFICELSEMINAMKVDFDSLALSVTPSLLLVL